MRDPSHVIRAVEAALRVQCLYQGRQPALGSECDIYRLIDRPQQQLKLRLVRASSGNIRPCLLNPTGSKALVPQVCARRKSPPISRNSVGPKASDDCCASMDPQCEPWFSIVFVISSWRISQLKNQAETVFPRPAL